MFNGEFQLLTIVLILWKSRKRKLDKLTSAGKLNGGQLQKAATLKGDESILLHIEGKDCE